MIQSPQSTEIQTWNIERFVPYARNPRKNDAAVDRMCSSIREYGSRFRCWCAADGTSRRWTLAIEGRAKLRLTEMPVLMCDEWTETQVKAFRLMVNRSVTWAA